MIEIHSPLPETLGARCFSNMKCSDFMKVIQCMYHTTLTLSRVWQHPNSPPAVIRHITISAAKKSIFTLNGISRVNVSSDYICQMSSAARLMRTLFSKIFGFWNCNYKQGSTDLYKHT